MKKILSILLIIAVSFYSCTDLQEEVLDEAMGEDLLSNDDIADGLLAPVYAGMGGFWNSGTDYFALQEISSDEGILPYRGGTDWYDGGKYIELHQHTYTATHGIVSGCWEVFIRNASRALLAINKLSEIDTTAYATEIAEAKALYALNMSYLLDGWGLVLKKEAKDFGNSSVTSKVLRSTEAFNYLITLLDEAEPNLKLTNEIGSGRFSKGAVWALKSRLYLNKAVFVDPYAPTHTFSSNDMDQVITNCDKVINSSDYALETKDYFTIFNADNHNHPELIFALDASLDANGSSRIPWFCLSLAHYASANYENRGAQGADGMAITSEFYDSWAGNMDDPRFFHEYIPQKDTAINISDYKLNRGILTGQQWGIVPNADGKDYKKDAGGKLIIEKLNAVQTGTLLIYTREVDLEGGVNSRHVSGYRASKYEYDPSSNTKNNGGVDIPFLRLGDVYLMKAEALLRKGQTDAAKNVVNTLRSARGAKPIGSLNLEQMYKERGYEMYLEMVRRQDMIRFDKFELPLVSKTNNDISRRLFPIPQYAIDANPSLLIQNKGY